MGKERGRQEGVQGELERLFNERIEFTLKNSNIENYMKIQFMFSSASK